MRVKVKICGITNLEDALAAIKSGCSALGFIFYKKSPRYTAPLKARNIINRLPKIIKKVGVFVNTQEKEIRQIAKLCRLDMLQFHGSESPEFCARFKNYKIIKAFRINPVRNTKSLGKKDKISNGVKDKIDFKNISKYKTFAYLFDTYAASKAGGTGKKFNWNLIRHIYGIRRPIFLSGGLNEKNVRKAIEIVRPDWVDASSSLEFAPGRKDHKKVKRFIAAAKKL